MLGAIHAVPPIWGGVGGMLLCFGFVMGLMYFFGLIERAAEAAIKQAADVAELKAKVAAIYARGGSGPAAVNVSPTLSQTVSPSLKIPPPRPPS